MFLPTTVKKCIRSISLTSCIGKVEEHVVNNRISKHIERQGLFPQNVIGFHPNLSTQDAMKLIKHYIIDARTRDVWTILGLDLEKAFDNLPHEEILRSAAGLDLGCRFHAFLSSFLQGRKASIKLGDLKSEPIALGGKSTPQGSVISPLFST